MSGGTDLMPSLKYFTSVIRERNHKDKCIIVVTDGQTENMQECADLIRNLRKYNTCVVGIGLKLGDDPKWFTSLFKSIISPLRNFNIKEFVCKGIWMAYINEWINYLYYSFIINSPVKIKIGTVIFKTGLIGWKSK